MLNRNPSACTAAQQSTKSSLLFRPAQFLAILMLAAGLLLSSCENQNITQKSKLQKPFVIVNKYIQDEEKKAMYYYQDANGIEYNFTDLKDKYNVGDTLR